jgi:16S rRNA (adenine1518-N6/adenine1519-N6)-dimethyltransferase
MRDVDRQTRSKLMSLFKASGFHPRGDLGQNFLIDLNLIEYVVEHARLGPRDVVLEIGTGTGGMTAALSDAAGAVISVEIDPRVHGLACSHLADRKNVTLLNTDALRNKHNLHPDVIAAVTRELNVAPDRRLKLVANLPYCIATPVISNLVASTLPWRNMVVTIQWELAVRMRARPGGGDYSALSVWLQSQAYVRILKRLRPQVFWPRPQVDSAIVRLTPSRELQSRIVDRPFFQDFVRRLFTQRRKLLRGVIAGMYRRDFTKPELDAALAPFEFKESTRAETLSVATLVDLGNAVRRLVHGETPPDEPSALDLWGGPRWIDPDEPTDEIPPPDDRSDLVPEADSPTWTSQVSANDDSANTD